MSELFEHGLFGGGERDERSAGRAGESGDANALRVIAISAGLSEPSSTRMLADRLSQATVRELAARGVRAEVETIELREHAHDIMTTMLQGYSPAAFTEVLERVTQADAIVAVTPVFTAGMSGLFKSFFDVLEPDALAGMPVLLGATAGTARHSLVVEHGIRPMFAYLHALTGPTGVFAATDDWGSAATGGDESIAKRIDRAAREFAPMVAASERVAKDDDFLQAIAGFDPAGGAFG